MKGCRIEGYGKGRRKNRRIWEGRGKNGTIWEREKNGTIWERVAKWKEMGKEWGRIEGFWEGRGKNGRILDMRKVERYYDKCRDGGRGGTSNMQPYSHVS